MEDREQWYDKLLEPVKLDDKFPPPVRAKDTDAVIMAGYVSVKPAPERK